MKKSEGKYLYRALCAVLMAVIATAMFAFVWLRFVKVNNITGHLLGKGNIGMALLIYAILFILLGDGLRAFKIGVERKATTLASVALAIMVTDVIEVFLSLAITGAYKLFWQFTWRYILLCFVQVAVLCLITIVMIDVYRKKFPPLQLLEIYGDYKHGLHHKIDSIPYKYHVKELQHYSITDKELTKKIEESDAVLISDVPSHEKNRVLKICFDLNKRVYLVPKISDVIIQSSERLNLIDTPLFLCRNTGISLFEAFIKRFFDIVLSGLALVVLSPLLIITAKTKVLLFSDRSVVLLAEKNS